MDKNALHMREPIWVWLYDYGPATHPDGWSSGTVIRADGSTVLAYPQAHTYAFRNYADAIAHPGVIGWSKNHHYILQKTYLN